jgi:hypothetical protein
LGDCIQVRLKLRTGCAAARSVAAELLGLAREQFASTSAYVGMYNSVLGCANQFTTARDTSPMVNAMANSGAAHVSELKRTADRLDDRLASVERELQPDHQCRAVEGK